MKQNLKCFFTFVEGDTRSSWYRYSDGPPPTLAMRNFSEKQRKEVSFQHFLISFVLGNKCIGSFPYYHYSGDILFLFWSIFLKEIFSFYMYLLGRAKTYFHMVAVKSFKKLHTCRFWRYHLLLSIVLKWNKWIKCYDEFLLLLSLADLTFELMTQV